MSVNLEFIEVVKAKVDECIKKFKLTDKDLVSQEPIAGAEAQKYESDRVTRKLHPEIDKIINAVCRNYAMDGVDQELTRQLLLFLYELNKRAGQDPAMVSIAVVDEVLGESTGRKRLHVVPTLLQDPQLYLALPREKKIAITRSLGPSENLRMTMSGKKVNLISFNPVDEAREGDDSPAFAELVRSIMPRQQPTNEGLSEKARAPEEPLADNGKPIPGVTTSGRIRPEAGDKPSSLDLATMGILPRRGAASQKSVPRAKKMTPSPSPPISSSPASPSEPPAKADKSAPPATNTKPPTSLSSAHPTFNAGHMNGHVNGHTSNIDGNTRQIRRVIYAPERLLEILGFTMTRKPEPNSPDDGSAIVNIHMIVKGSTHTTFSLADFAEMEKYLHREQKRRPVGAVSDTSITNLMTWLRNPQRVQDEVKGR